MIRVRSLALAASLLAACGGAQEPGPSRLVLGAECPAGTSWDGSGCSPKEKPIAAGPALCPDGRAPDRGECPPVEDAEEPPEVERPPLHHLRDPRPHVHKPRSASLLKTEIRQLKALFEVTPRESPERPLILRRLADDNAELAWAAPREAESARSQAIQYYNMLATSYKTHCSSPPSKRCADEVLYLMGLEQELLGRLDEARKSYLALVQSFPQSTYVPYTYFAFGEHFFKEAMEQDRSKLPMAKQIYEKVTQFPDSPIVPEAMLRLAQIADAEGDVVTAEQHRKRAAAMRPAPVEPSPAPRQ
jgi:hypothetical protein